MNTVIASMTVKRNQLTECANLYGKDFYECLKMDNGACARKHLDACGEFAINFLQNYTVT